MKKPGYSKFARSPAGEGGARAGTGCRNPAEGIPKHPLGALKPSIYALVTAPFDCVLGRL
jgi:hypothetical protein